MFSPSPVLQIKRSTKGTDRLSKSDRSLQLPDEVVEILIGILLGDAHIIQKSPTANSRLVYGQTAVKHKEYFNYVFSFFVPFCVNNYIPKYRIVKDNRTNKTYSAISFRTMQLPCFNEFRHIFYPINIKIIPDNICELLTPRGLAFWLMDDGSKHGDGMHIGVYGFTNMDVDKLMYTLQYKFNIKCSIHFNKEKKPRIYIFKESMDTLITLVKPYFIKEMLYKLGL